MTSFYSRLVKYLLPAAIFYFFHYLVFTSPAAMKPELSISLGATPSDFAAMTSYYATAYALAQIPIGIILDKFLPRRSLSISCFVYSISIMIFALSNSVSVCKLIRILMGVCGGFGLLGCLKTASLYFSKDEYATLTGMSLTVGMLGAAIGQGGAVFFIRLFGGNWQLFMIALSIFALCLSILLWFTLRDPDDALESAKNLEIDFKNLAKNLWIVIGRLNVWTVALYAALMFLPTMVLLTWGIPFLTEVHDFSRDEAGFINSILFIGFALGAPLYGAISDKYNNRFTLLYVANIVTLALSLVYLLLPPFVIMFLLLTFLIGFSSSGFILAFAIAKEMNPLYLSGTTSGFLNSVNNLIGSVVSGSLFPIVACYFGEILILSTGESVYSFAGYQAGLSLIPFSLLLGLGTLVITHILWMKQKTD